MKSSGKPKQLFYIFFSCNFSVLSIHFRHFLVRFVVVVLLQASNCLVVFKYRVRVACRVGEHSGVQNVCDFKKYFMIFFFAKFDPNLPYIVVVIICFLVLLNVAIAMTKVHSSIVVSRLLFRVHSVQLSTRKKIKFS